MESELCKLDVDVLLLVPELLHNTDHKLNILWGVPLGDRYEKPYFWGILTFLTTSLRLDHGFFGGGGGSDDLYRSFGRGFVIQIKVREVNICGRMTSFSQKIQVISQIES